MPDAIPRKKEAHILGNSFLLLWDGVPSHAGVWLFEELFQRSRNLLHVNLKCCVGFYPPFSWRFRKEWKRQSQLQIPLQPFFDFLLRFSKHAYSGNKRHVSSLERLITGLWSPDIRLLGEGQQRGEWRVEEATSVCGEPSGSEWLHLGTLFSSASL